MPRLVKSPLCVVATIACATVVAGAEIHLRGSLEQQGKTLLLLKHSHYPKQLEWVAVGGSFRGYAVTSYDPQRGVVHLQKGDQSWEAALASAPARIPPARSTASEVMAPAGVRCCAVHRAPLVETLGYGMPSEVIDCVRPNLPLLIAFPKKRGEFPNTLGERIQREKSEFHRVEIVREHCTQCDAAYERYVTQVTATEVASRSGSIPSPFR